LSPNKLAGLICVASTIATAGVTAYVIEAAPEIPARPPPIRETALADLPGLPGSLRYDFILGLNAKPLDTPEVVSGESPLELTAVRSARNRHAVAMQFSGLNPGGAYHATAWVKSDGSNVLLQVRDAVDDQTGKSPDEGEVDFDFRTGASTTDSGNLLAHGVDSSADGWHKAWVDLKTDDGNIFVLLGLIEGGGTGDVFRGHGEHVLLGGIEVAPKP
jgi:hypothetical protein